MNFLTALAILNGKQ